MGGLEMICVYLEPVHVLYFGGWTLQNKVFSFCTLQYLFILIFSATCGYLWVSLYLSFDRHNTDMIHIIYVYNVYIYIYTHTTPLEMAQADPQTK